MAIQGVVRLKILAWLAALLGMSVYAVASAADVQKQSEQAVVIHFHYGSRDLTKLFELENKLEAVVAKARVGEYDGHEVAIDGSDGFLYLYGPDADKLFQVIRPTLEKASFIRGAEVVKRYGPAGAGTQQVVLSIQ